ncbi:MAG: hypothetical protein H7196_01700 [candidate division SR1 bacterium]|nr:hypothetical protein [candidate division SR1 bacterium]
MKRKEVVLFTILFIISALFGAYLTFNTFSNESIGSITEKTFAKNLNPNIVKQTQISDSSKNNNFNTDAKKCMQLQKTDFTETIDKNLTVLEKYQDLCDSLAVSQMMFIIDMPTNEEGAIIKAKKIAPKLKEFAKYRVLPLIIAEPTDGDNKISFKEFSSGKYNEVFDLYFKTIKDEGVTDDQIGMWVPFPEYNVPYWNFDGTLPSDFGTNINNYITPLKKYFKAKTGILLNSQTYYPEDSNWEYGSYDSFIPYLKGVKKGLIDSFGVQGLPWVSPASTKRVEQFDPKEYLATDLIIEAAKFLKVREVWVNTGTFSEKYTNDIVKKTNVSINSRKTMLNGVLSEAEKLKNDKFQVTINLFAQDKSYLGESTNWSYFGSQASKKVLREFFATSNDKEIKLSLFDKDL